MIEKIVYNDADRPHRFGEISALLSPGAAATLDQDNDYGVQWYNRQRVMERTVSEPDGASLQKDTDLQVAAKRRVDSYTRHFPCSAHDPAEERRSLQLLSLCPAAKHAYTCKQKSLKVEKVEATVWDFVCGMLKHPERIPCRHGPPHDADGTRLEGGETGEYPPDCRG